MTTTNTTQAITLVDRYIGEHTDDLIEAVRTLVRFKTESVDLLGLGDPLPNEEAQLQEWVADRLAKQGFEVDQWEPDAAELRDNRIVPEWHHWHDRPMTVGRLVGTGGGRSLMINGHVDVVPAGDVSRWTYPPFDPQIADGRIYGRGTTDMKGGIAAALIAVEALQACGVRLRGDVLFEAVTDEEIGGMGSVAAAARGYQADAAIIPEPTSLNIYTATRGILHARLEVVGRAAHAEVAQPDWRDGGGVNANHMALRIADGLLGLEADRSSRPTLRHPLLSAPSLQITGFHGGSYIATIPEKAELLMNLTYLPVEADSNGFGSLVQAELEAVVDQVVSQQDWLAQHPPRWTWILDYPPYELPAGSPILDAVIAAASDAGVRDPHAVGLDSGYDGAPLSALFGLKSVAFGPGDIQVAHSTDEFVPIDELVLAAKSIARMLIDWCEVDTTDNI
ncbi:MAG: ArgE/DapE family deacylase [Propionibacteriaceae bacterium]|nr:ArgE/DapE family deacylase [Propionibacteriaceae bacterium]